ncbi:hypothetical protein [Rhodoblastus sp.]|uniref:hypothetical protein n=1 Tax=Rhodoblastus sp. TaxID=1962975 RepID=UPI0025FC0F59|nr:hypothetical protein [Rhodoblastus sp.]
MGRTATEAERVQLRKIRDALDLRDNDALWSVLFALQYYDSLYRQFPKAIAAEATKILAETRAASEAVMRANVASAHADLARAVALTAQGVARSVARRWQLRWTIIGAAVGAIIFASGVFAGLRL